MFYTVMLLTYEMNFQNFNKNNHNTVLKLVILCHRFRSWADFVHKYKQNNKTTMAKTKKHNSKIAKLTAVKQTT